MHKLQNICIFELQKWIVFVMDIIASDSHIATGSLVTPSLMEGMHPISFDIINPVLETAPLWAHSLVTIEPLAGLRGAQGTAPRGANSFNFMQVLRKFAKILCWHPQECWRLHLGGNLWSATGTIHKILRMGFYHPTDKELSTTLLWMN